MAALSAQAEAQALTLEDWFKALADRETSAAHCRRIAREAAKRMPETRHGAKPDPD